MEEFVAREASIHSAMTRLDELTKERGLPDNIVRQLRTQLKGRLQRVEHRSDESGHKKLSELHDEIDLILIATERQTVNELYRNDELKDEARRRIERDLDLREAHVANVRAEDN